MMSKITKALMVAALIVAGGSARLSVAGPDDVDPAALAVAQTYFAALQSGDRDTLLSLFAGRALASNEAQLSDPDYSQFLVDRYSSARFEVSNGGVQNGVAFVDVTIWLNDTESVRERLVMKPSADAADSSLYIVSQSELMD
jgi:hypothetical protein